jgi:DNA-binding response OmpR family regulator
LHKILIVDDDRATSTLLRTLFQIEGYDGIICPRPDEVLPVARREKPGLILMDVHLADTDAIEILTALKADVALRTVPVVMTSGMDVEDRCMNAGANAFMLKPFKPTELMSIIRRELVTAR